MKTMSKLFLGLALLIFYSCGEDGDPITENQSPGSFSATVSNISTTSATLSWTDATDPDGDQVTYEVTLSNSVLGAGDSETDYNLTGLTEGTQYSGSIVASDGNGGVSTANFSFETTTEQSEPEHTIDPTLFNSEAFSVEAKLVDCTLENGSVTKCYELTFVSNPVPDDGPFCPSSLEETGGMGIYDGPTNNSGNDQGFQVMKASLFQDMENDGYDIIDANGGINISDFSGMDNQSFAYCLEPLPDDNLILKFTIPAIPEDLSTANTIQSVELIGVSLDGVPMNGDPPSVTTGQMGNGNIPSLDPCGGHHDPSGYYHWHFIAESTNEVLNAFGMTEISCTNTAQNSSALTGFAKDGYPIYAYADSDGSEPTNLDACNGHVSATNEYPNGVYHYHAYKDRAPNMPECIIGAAVNNPFQVN